MGDLSFKCNCWKLSCRGPDSDKQLRPGLNSCLVKMIVGQWKMFSGLKYVEVEITCVVSAILHKESFLNKIW